MSEEKRGRECNGMPDEKRGRECGDNDTVNEKKPKMEEAELTLDEVSKKIKLLEERRAEILKRDLLLAKMEEECRAKESIEPVKVVMAKIDEVAKQVESSVKELMRLQKERNKMLVDKKLTSVLNSKFFLSGAYCYECKKYVSDTSVCNAVGKILALQHLRVCPECFGQFNQKHFDTLADTIKMIIGEDQPQCVGFNIPDGWKP